MKKILILIFSILSLSVNAQIDKVIPSPQNPSRIVNDFADILTPAQESQLEQKLIDYNDTTGSQIAIVTVNSIGYYDVAEYALALGRKWGVGGKQFSNGIVILVAKQERKIRIEVGYGLEGAITDVTSKDIIDNSITPAFKQGRYYEGLDQATTDIIKAAEGEYKAPAKKKEGKGRGIGIIIMILIFLFVFGGGGGRTGGMASRRGYREFGTGWILGSILGSLGSGGRGGGGWSGGGGGGGGFGGFGGGGFGGGGASGSW